MKTPVNIRVFGPEFKTVVGDLVASVIINGTSSCDLFKEQLLQLQSDVNQAVVEVQGKPKPIREQIHALIATWENEWLSMQELLPDVQDDSAVYTEYLHRTEELRKRIDELTAVVSD